MKDKPLVSIIVNCYNGELFLKDSIDSIYHQTYTNWEIIFYDNQSTDSTKDVIQTYNDPRINYYYAEQHYSLGEARNNALRFSKGELITFLDADDIWKPGFLEIGIKILDFYGDRLAGFYCNYYHFNSNYEELRKSKTSGIRDFSYLLRNYDIGMSGIIVKNSIIKENKINFNANYFLIEDFDFFIRLSLFAPFYYSDEGLMKYRIHTGSLTNSFRNGWAKELNMFKCDLEKNILTINQIEENKDTLKWLKVRSINAEINENIKESNKVEILKLIFKNLHLSIKLLFPLVFVLSNEKTYYSVLKRFKPDNYIFE